LKPEQFRLAKDFETNMILAQPHTHGNTGNPVYSFHVTVKREFQRVISTAEVAYLLKLSLSSCQAVMALN
jgi:hypothetical protein